MKSKKLSDLFLKCLRGPFIHTDNSGDYYAERIGDTLYIYLECSSGEEDWRNNFDFPAAPYREMNDGIWFCHRGFLRVWKSVEDDIKILVRDSGIRSAVGLRRSVVKKISSRAVFSWSVNYPAI